MITGHFYSRVRISEFCRSALSPTYESVLTEKFLTDSRTEFHSLQQRKKEKPPAITLLIIKEIVLKIILLTGNRYFAHVTDLFT